MDRHNAELFHPLTLELIKKLRSRGFNHAANYIEQRMHACINTTIITELFSWDGTPQGADFWLYISAKFNEKWINGDSVTYPNDLN